MHTHNSSCLAGPISRARDWWRQEVDEAPTVPKEERPFRAELVERVRREIAEGTYDAPEKWEAALDRLCARLEEE